MKERPKAKLQLRTIDKSFELLGWISIIAIWGLIIANYTNLPDIITTHYNAVGQADGFSGRGTILILPVIATILYVALTVLNRFPHVFNDPTDITPDNALRQYTSATRLIRYLKLIIVIIFGLIVFKTIQNTDGRVDGLGIWFLPLTMALVFIPLTYFVIKSFQAKQ